MCCLCVWCPGPLDSCSPVCPLGVLFCLCGFLGHLAPVHRCARPVRCFVYAVSWATWLLFIGVHSRCVAFRVRCPGPLRSCSPVCTVGVLPACAVSWATWLLFTGVPARCVACLCGDLGHLAPVQRSARLVCCFACAVSRATWLLFTGVPARCVVLRVRCPGPPGSCSPVRSPGVLVRCLWPLGSCSPVCPLGDLPVCRCPGPLGSYPPVCPLGVLPACAVSWATWLLLTGVPARCSACVLVSWATWLLSTGVPASCVACVRGVLGHLAPVHRWARSVLCLCVRCPGPLGSCPPVCPLGALLCLCGVLGHLAPVHRCARSVCCVACAVSWAPWLLFTGVLAGCAVRCPGPLGSCSPVCPLHVLCCGLRGRGVAAGWSLVHLDGVYS